MFIKRILLPATFALVSYGISHAGTVVVPYSGSYDEATGAQASGDYDNIGGLSDVGLFNLVAGDNVFDGSIFTPTDPADVFLIGIGANQTLTGVTVDFGLNLSPFNPLFAAPAPTFNLSSTSGVDEIVNRVAGSNGQSSTSTFTSAFTRGEGQYAILFGNGTFAPNNGGPVDYRVTFSVTQTDPPPQPPAVPVGPALPLLASGLAVLALVRRGRAK